MTNSFNFLVQNYLIIANNIKPSRSQNSLFDVEELRKNYQSVLEANLDVLDNDLAELLEVAAKNSVINNNESQSNEHTSQGYRAIHFTCRQLIKYKSPFVKQFSAVKKLAKMEDSELSKKILSLDTSSISQDIRFFYPYEVQITDLQSHEENTDGEASHQEYKKSQLTSALLRLFKPLLEFKNISLH